jgi:hypothetical protein
MSGRIRSIKPEWLEDERMVMASAEARVLSVALLLLADDHGNGRMVAAIEASRIFPASPRVFPQALLELESMRFVQLYQLDGQKYFSIRNWEKHQRVDKPGKPRVPRPLDAGVEKVPGGLAKFLGSLATDPDPDLDPDPDHEHRTTTTTVSAKTKTKRVRQNLPGALPAGATVPVRLAWVEAWEKKYPGQKAAWGRRENGQVSQLLGTYTADELVGLVPYFFAWQRPEVIRGGHSFGKGPACFVLKVDELRADIADSDRRKSAAVAEANDKRANKHSVNDDALQQAFALIDAREAS